MLVCVFFFFWVILVLYWYGVERFSEVAEENERGAGDWGYTVWAVVKEKCFRKYTWGFINLSWQNEQDLHLYFFLTSSFVK